MKWLRWALIGLLVGAVVAFAVELVLPRRRAASGYRAPEPATDVHAVLPTATGARA